MKRAIRRSRTAPPWRTIDQRLARRRAGVTRVLNALKDGAALHLSYQNGRAIWRLSFGPFVTSEIADVITHDPNVVGAGDALFSNHPDQTWRYINEH